MHSPQNLACRQERPELFNTNVVNREQIRHKIKGATKLDESIVECRPSSIRSKTVVDNVSVLVNDESTAGISPHILSPHYAAYYGLFMRWAC